MRRIKFKSGLACLIFVALLFAAIPGLCAVTQTAVIATAAADYSSGAHAIASVDPVGGPRVVETEILPTISDIGVAAYGQFFYRIEKLNADNITKFDISDPDTVIWQYSTMDADDGDTSCNPHSMIFVSAEKAYVLRLGSTKAWIVNPAATTEDDFKIGELDLSDYADSDGIPEMNTGVIINGKLFIIVNRLDRNNSWAPTNTAYIAVFDTSTDIEIDTGITNADGLKGIPLDIQNCSGIQYMAGKIYVQGAGRYASSWSGTPAEYSGGIISIDPSTYETTLVLDDGDDENHPYGNISGMVIISATKGYFVGYAGWGDNTLYSFDPSTGESVSAISGFENISIAGMQSGVYADNNGLVWVCNQTDARIDILNPADDSIDESVSTDLNPLMVAFTSEGSPDDDDGDDDDDDDDDFSCFISAVGGDYQSASKYFVLGFALLGFAGFFSLIKSKINQP